MQIPVMIALAGLAVSSAALGQTSTASVRGRDHSLVATIPAAGPGFVHHATRPNLPGCADGMWEQMVVPPGAYIRAISMSYPTSFAAAELGIVLRSNNGGETWQVILNEGFPIYYYGVHAFPGALGNQRVLVTGFNNSANTGVFRWSDDGGNTWGPLQTLSPASPIRWLYFVNFADANHGVIQAAIGTHHTTNGGRLPADWTFVAPSNNWFQGPFNFFPDLRVWMTGYDNFRSTNGGASWTPLPNASPVFDGPSSFTTDGRGFIGGGSISPSVAGWIYSTTSGGDSWSAQPVAQPPYPVRAILKFDSRRAWAVGGNIFSSAGGIWATADGGQTWSEDQNTGSELLDIKASVRLASTTVDVFAAGMVSQIWRLRVPICYANCDESIGSPTLTPNDFQCFLNRFAAFDPYANCDNSSGIPMLTPNDFVCFLSEFAHGCP
jgi:photosystem II stability/assembly factor-like uncharacterized protein